ncbi:C-_U-editing enzyme APOBEC-1-like [Carettochelys insculpta]|uniref:C->U-editing enzyme APOBEC-1-like n=1 Tax=Carettochelys insculpta TaxID=44489 RepID=UPI003EB9DB1C
MGPSGLQRAPCPKGPPEPGSLPVTSYSGDPDGHKPVVRPATSNREALDLLEPQYLLPIHYLNDMDIPDWLDLPAATYLEETCRPEFTEYPKLNQALMEVEVELKMIVAEKKHQDGNFTDMGIFVMKSWCLGYHVSRGITQRGKILQETFIDSYNPSVLRRVHYLLYEIKWSSSRRSWQGCCHSTRTEHAEGYFLQDVFRDQRCDPSDHCSITLYMSWSPCGDCCREIRDFLREKSNVNLVIYIARIYWHKDENNRQGLRSLVNIGVTIRIMDLPVYSYCWRTFVCDEDKDEDDYWPRHLAPWIMLYSLELQSILQNIPSCLEISVGENQAPIFSLCVEEDLQKRALASASP